MATGTFELYFASKHSGQLLPVYATRMTDRYATIGNKRHPLYDEAGNRTYFTDKAEAYKAVLAQRLADAQRYCKMLAEFNFASDSEPWEGIESLTYMVNMKNHTLRNWVLYGETLKKEGLAI